MRAFIYTRVSSQEQANEGFSLDAQMDRLRAYCDSQEWTIAGIYTDEGISAKDTERPRLQEMLADIETGQCDVVLVYKLDRLTRSVVDLHELLKKFDKHRVGFKSATEVFDTTSAMGRLFITIIAALAQWERENLGERTKMGQVEMTKQGKWSGGKPAFGYDYVDGQLVINEPQAVVVREIFRRYAAGTGTRHLLSWLNHPSNPQLAPNRRWTLHALKYLLGNPLYAGYVRYGHRDIHGRRKGNAIVERGAHEAIITEDTFMQVSREREQRSKMPGRSGAGTFAFSGVLYCAECGSSMAGRIHYRANKDTSPPRRAYICSERMHSGICKMPQRTETYIESEVLLKIGAYYEDLATQMEELRAEKSDVDKLQKSILSQINKLKDQDERLLVAYRKGHISLDEFATQRGQLRDEQSKLESQFVEANDGTVAIRLELLMSLLGTLRSTWQDTDASTRKRMVQSIISRIELDREGNITILYN